MSSERAGAQASAEQSAIAPPPTPPPPPEETGTEPHAARQTATLPPASKEENAPQVLFDQGSTELSEAARSALRNIASRLRQENDLRLELRAYANGSEGSASHARRMSLSRALIIRSFLEDHGISPTRIDIRALGTATSGPRERVDLVPTRR